MMKGSSKLSFNEVLTFANCWGNSKLDMQSQGILEYKMYKLNYFFLISLGYKTLATPSGCSMKNQNNDGKIHLIAVMHEYILIEILTVAH